MTPLEAAIRRVLDGPKGPGIGAFFAFDGTLIDGYSAAAYLADRLDHREPPGQDRCTKPGR